MAEGSRRAAIAQASPRGRRPLGLAGTFDESPAARAIGGGLGLAAGISPGVAQGAWHLAEDLGGGLVFAGRLLDPSDRARSAAGQAAWDTVADAGVGALRYAAQMSKDPSVAFRDLGRLADDAKTKLVPGASKPGATFGDEFRRNFDVGLNQGEALFDVGSLLVGGAELKSLAALGYFEKGGQAAKYLARGYEPRIARYFAEPYAGPMGAHFIPRSAKLPAFLGGGPVPKWYLDSPLNVVKPIGRDKGAVFEHHYKTDPRMHGGKVSGGGGWSGKQLGWSRYSPVSRGFYAMPGPLKAALAGGLAGIGGAVDNVFHPRQAR